MFMKRILVLFLWFWGFSQIYAQQLSVQSFYLDEADKTASSDNTKMIDQNGVACAIIKVITTLRGISFDVGSLGIIKTEQHKNEVWVYVPEGVKRITISHQQYGLLRDYDLGQTLKRAKTYHLLLKNKMVSTKSFGSVDINSNPSMADIYIDGKNVGKTPCLISDLKPGKHQLRIMIPDYAEVAGQFECQKGQSIRVFADLNMVNAPSVLVDNVEFKMIFVEGGMFAMGATKEQSNPEDNEKPVHQVTLSSYYIGETEVTQQLWEAVMGSNPSVAKGPYRPVCEVSWDDCQLFIKKLNQKTGLAFRLPTEAEWEYAARGGKKSQGYQYSGSDDLNLVGWYRDNSTDYGGGKGNYNNVRRLSPNELGLYDMSGGVWEWCQDKMGTYSNSSQTNPLEMAAGDERVIRGGSRKGSMWSCRNAVRNCDSPDSRNDCVGLRLALQSFPTDYFINYKLVTEQQVEDMSSVVSGTATDTICFNVRDVSFSMVHVDGGAFYVWDGEGYSATEMQPIMSDIYGNNYFVEMRPYYIGETEVTQELWEAVMGANPVDTLQQGNNRPVVNVSWNDCQDFITKLNEITGKFFRLPTDAEWQFAAQGGVKSKGFNYCGSNNLSDVAWYGGNSKIVNPVKMKQPNELGIFDMSGNVWEWTNERSKYLASGRLLFIIRGACVLNQEIECDIRYRGREVLTLKSSTIGLRLALTE